ncbi:MAG: hypothetical protein C0402_01210 [Thermodesulfovibrio sp.]|nr:hypothetical protein [Thermodesulfovibrio sp.]
MTSAQDSVARITYLIAGIIAVVIVIAIPAGYFAVSYQYLGGSIDAQAELSASAIELLVAANPRMWQFEEVRLQEILERHHEFDVPETRLVRDIRGNIMARIAEPVSPPVIKRSFGIYESGTRVGNIEISRSLLPLAGKTSLVCLGSLLLGIVIFYILSVVPLKAVRGAYHSLEESERALRSSEEFIREALDNIDDGFLVIGPDYRIIIANRTYRGWANTQSDGITGRHCYEVLHKKKYPCHEDGADCVVKLVFDTGEFQTGEQTYEDSSGLTQHIEKKAFPIKDKSGAVTSVIEVVRNITEHRLLESEQLKTQKLEAMGTLAGGIAHDFNNLLQGVFGYMSMAKMHLDQREKALAMIEQAEKALNMSVNLTTQLLTFSKGGKPVKKMITLKPVIETAAKFALSGSSSDYRAEIAPDLWRVAADEGQIGQVVQNIVLNAKQAMPHGGTVEILAGNISMPEGENPLIPDGGKFVEIVIRDCGIGMTDEKIARIFDPYYTTKQSGSGLGLATAHSIIKNHDGMIEVASVPDKGSTFTIYLPANSADEETLQAVPLSVSVRKGKILVMDDEEMVRAVAASMLQAMGHEVVSVKDGEEAIETFRKARNSDRPFDIVILDLTIRGGMGGELAVRELLEIDPKIKAVVSSGYADNQVIADYKTAGFTAFLNKPYRIDELAAKLSELLA